MTGCCADSNRFIRALPTPAKSRGSLGKSGSALGRKEPWRAVSNLLRRGQSGIRPQVSPYLCVRTTGEVDSTRRSRVRIRREACGQSGCDAVAGWKYVVVLRRVLGHSVWFQQGTLILRATRTTGVALHAPATDRDGSSGTRTRSLWRYDRTGAGRAGASRRRRAPTLRPWCHRRRHCCPLRASPPIE